MKKLLIIYFLLSLCFEGASQTTKQLDDLFGFKNFKLLTSINDYRKNYAIEKYYKGKNELCFYKLAGETYNIKLGEYKVKKIDFYTIKDTIYYLLVEFDGLSLNTIESAFGKPSETVKTPIDIFSKTSSYFTWKGSKVILTMTQSHTPSKNMEGFGHFDTYLEFKLVDEHKVIERLSNKSKDILSDFGDAVSTDISKKSDEPCSYNTHTINVLNQNWYTGSGIFLGTHDNNGFDKKTFGLDVAKNKSRSILIIEVSFDDKGDYFIEQTKFKGNIEILLSNGKKISCIDRSLNGKQVNQNGSKSIFAVYYLTDSEYITLSKTDISSVSCKFGDPLNGFRNFVFDDVNNSLKCSIEGINEYVK